MAKFDLEAEVRDLAARRDITGAVQRYMRGLDRLDRDLLMSAFHEDAFIDAGLQAGPPGPYCDFCIEFLGQTGGSHHLLGQVQIDFHGPDKASGECYFQAWHESFDENGKPGDLLVSGRYIDEYTCKNGKWRIAKRRLITDWVIDQPANRAFFDNPEIHRGARQGEDFSETRNWPED